MRRETSDGQTERGDLSFGPILRASPSSIPVGRQKESALMGRLGAYLAQLGNPMQDCHLRKEPALRSML